MEKHHFEDGFGKCPVKLRDKMKVRDKVRDKKTALKHKPAYPFTICPDVPNIFLFNVYREIKRVENKEVVKNKFQIIFIYIVTVQLGYFFGTSGQNRLAYL